MEHHSFNQKYKGYVQPNNQNVYEVLNSRLKDLIPNWNRSNILDFGCNVGHLLLTAGDQIDHEKFYGVEIHKASIFIAKQKFPKANWIHYNGYNATFNPTGLKDAMFELPVQPDVIVAYGVFTHCDFNDVEKWMTVFQSMVKPGGWIVFSVWEDIDFQGYQAFLRKAFGMKTNFPTPEYERSMYFLNRKEMVLDSDALGVEHADWVEAFYKQSFLESKFPGLLRLEGAKSMHPVYALHVA